MNYKENVKVEKEDTEKTNHGVFHPINKLGKKDTSTRNLNDITVGP